MPAAGRKRGQPEIPEGNIVLVGLMGAGKSCIGRKLAQRLRLPFVDADAEIEKAAGCSISEIFEEHGEQAFRDGERRVIARPLDQKVEIGTQPDRNRAGGAYMDPETRKAIAARAVSIWLRADLDLLVQRTGRRDTRPLLKTGDPRQILGRLIDQRYPVYAEADITVDSLDAPAEKTVKRVLDALRAHGREAAAQ